MRFLVVLDHDPLSASGIDALREVRERMPGLLAAVGLPGAETSYAGDTALGLSLVDTAAADLGRVAVAVLLVDLLLVWFLRALVAPLYLLATSITAAGVTLAASFALVALVPVAPFEELAVAVAIGVLIDAFLVRSVLVPALVTLVGPVSTWPAGARIVRRPSAR